MERFASLSFGFLAGGFARYALMARVHDWAGAAFPYGTLAVNLSGCLAIGVFDALVQTRVLVSPETRLMLLTGFCGAYTTFSALIIESVKMADQGQWVRALANYLLSGLGGVLLFKLGGILVRSF